MISFILFPYKLRLTELKYQSSDTILLLNIQLFKYFLCVLQNDICKKKLFILYYPVSVTFSNVEHMDSPFSNCTRSNIKWQILKQMFAMM